MRSGWDSLRRTQPESQTTKGKSTAPKFKAFSCSDSILRHILTRNVEFAMLCVSELLQVTSSKEYDTVLTVQTQQDCVLENVSKSFILNLTLQSNID